jgi:hypothetical protein
VLSALHKSNNEETAMEINISLLKDPRRPTVPERSLSQKVTSCLERQPRQIVARPGAPYQFRVAELGALRKLGNIGS